VAQAILSLADDPRAHGVKKLSAPPGWRLRVGEYRVICSIWDKDRFVLVERVARRNEKTYD
jgi:mRNA interferase RelE/StbE